MRIIKYQEKYKKQVQNLIKEILFEIFGEHELQPFEDFNSYLVFYIANEKDRIIGTIALKKDGEEIGILKRMYLEKKYRKKGLAQKLYNKIENYCKKNKIKYLKLSTTPQMKSAIKFYIKNGFAKKSYNKKTNQIFFEKELR